MPTLRNSERASLLDNRRVYTVSPPTRREMLSQTVAGLTSAGLALRSLLLPGLAGLEMAGAGLISAGSEALAEATQAETKPSFCTLGFSTYGMQSVKTEQALKVLAEIGYDAVELCIRTGWDADSAQLSTASRKALRAQLVDLPLRLSSLMEHVLPTDVKNQAVALERLKLAGALAHDLVPSEPPFVQTVLGPGQWEPSKARLRDYLGDWVKLAEERNIVIAIKPHRGGAVSQPAEAIWLLEQLGKPACLKMVYDYSHYAFRDLPLKETIELALPSTAHVVLKDVVEEHGQVVFKLPSEANTIDYSRILKQFYAGGYRGDFNCEVSGMVSGQPKYDPVAAAKICYVNVAKAFETAQIPRPPR